MKVLSGFLSFLAVVFLFGLGGMLIASSFGFVNISELIFGNELWVGVIGAAMFLLGLLVVIAAVSSARPEKTICVQDEEGEVNIACTAIEDVLRRASNDVEGIVEFRPNVSGSRRGVDISGRATVRTTVTIPELTRELHDMVRKQVNGVLGIKEIGRIKIRISKIVSERSEQPEPESENKWA